MSPDQNCYEFIKSWEGLRLKAYQDSAGIWTIGYGCIEFPSGVKPVDGMVIDKEKAEELLKWEVNLKALKVDTLIQGCRLNQNQYQYLPNCR